MNRILSVGIACGVSAVLAQSPESHTLPALHVHGDSNATLPPVSLIHPLPLDQAHEELGEAISILPGVHLSARGAHGNEPVLRGLGWERVATEINGLPLYGACPSRMDPPASLFTAGSLTQTTVDLGAPSVIHGPVPAAGRLRLSSELTLAGNETPPERYTVLSSRVASQGHSRAGSLTLGERKEQTAWRAYGALQREDDYHSADGKRVPAHLESREGAFQLLHALDDQTRVRAEYRWIGHDDVSYVALPMDTRTARTHITTLGVARKLRRGPISELDLEFGRAELDHEMDNRDKPNRGRLIAFTPSESDTTDARLLARLPMREGELRTGVDASRQTRRAIRTRTMRATGMTFRDPIWPEVEQDRAGVFGEWEGPLSKQWTLRAGARADVARSDADLADARIVPGPAIGPTTVRTAYREVGGAANSNVDREDTLVSGNIRVSRSLSPSWMLHLSAEHTEALPNLTQRYLAFGPIPGGYGVGNPDLEPEVKHGLEMRVEGAWGRHPLGLAAHAANIQKFHLPAIVARRDVNGDGIPDVIRGTQNRDAEIWGMELYAEARPATQWKLPLTLSWVRGRVGETGAPLPEMPPLSATAALRWEPEATASPELELGLRYNHKQDRVNDEFGEDPTPSHAVVHLRCAVEPRPGWKVQAGIENLLDREYHDHLTREALLPVGDLSSGDEIPAPGRSYTLSLQIDW